MNRLFSLKSRRNGGTQVFLSLYLYFCLEMEPVAPTGVPSRVDYPLKLFFLSQRQNPLAARSAELSLPPAQSPPRPRQCFHAETRSQFSFAPFGPFPKSSHDPACNFVRSLRCH